jgi:hypothetical protein
MRKRRIVSLTALSAAAASFFVLTTASPAAARPADCSFRVTMNRVGAGITGSVYVGCSAQEHFAVRVSVIREDRFTGANVASVYQGFHATGASLTALEPCSDVQTNKTYHATGWLYDTRIPLGGIEVKKVSTASLWGHC